MPGGRSSRRLAKGVDLGDVTTRPARFARFRRPPGLWPRHPPIRVRKAIPTAWLELVLREGATARSGG